MKTLLEKLLQKTSKGKRALLHQALITQVTEQIWVEMERLNISSADLARRMNVSRSAVSQLLSGSNNFTIAKLAEIADTLEIRALIKFAPKIERRGKPRVDDLIFPEKFIDAHSKTGVFKQIGAREGKFFYPPENQNAVNEVNHAREPIAA